MYNLSSHGNRYDQVYHIKVNKLLGIDMIITNYLTVASISDIQEKCIRRLADTNPGQIRE